MSANEFCTLQQCGNIGCSHLNRDKDLCTKVNPPRKPGEVRRGSECTIQTPRWSIKDCRAKKCEHLKNTSGYDDAQERCHALIGDSSLMPGSLTHCIQDLEHMPAEEFLRHAARSLLVTSEQEGQSNRKTPGVRNCPGGCPYKITQEGETKGKPDPSAKRVWVCAFTGSLLGHGMGGTCPCHVLDNPDQEHQIEVLKGIVRAAAQPAAGHLQCGGEFCPDGVKRCGIGETVCPVIKLPLADMKICPLWRIPVKLLPAAPQEPERVQESTENVEKQETPEERLARGKAIREEVRENREAMKRMSTGKTDLFPAAKEPAKEPSEDVCRHHKKKGCGIYSGIQDGVDTDKCDGRNPENWCYVEPVMEKQKRARKEKPDPICEACRERMKGNVPAHACEWCREEQKTKGRRAWVTDIKLGSVLLGDMNEIGKRVPDESTDTICTDPPYIQELYQQAYADLAALACRVLKPYGLLFAYVPNEHLDEIMDLLRFSTDGRQKEGLRYFWSIQSLNSGQVAKNHHHNALCMHKQILIFQKVPQGENIRGARRCFADVVRGYRQKRYHPWQQSVHDLISFLDRFMVPGEILLDPYAGTGTSLIAGQLLGMEVVGFEIDPKTHAIAVREMQQRPVDLTGFGIEDTAPDCEREPAPEPKDTSRQAAIEDPAKEARPVETHAQCLNCPWDRVCEKKDPHEGCRQEALEKHKADVKDLYRKTPKRAPQPSAGPTPQDRLDAALFTKENDTPLQLMRQDPDHGPQPVSKECLECEGFEECTSHDPHAGCLDAVKAIGSGIGAMMEKGDHGPFNIWQMRNCAGCPAPDPCDLRQEYLDKFEKNGSIALIKDCPRKEEVVGKVPGQDAPKPGGPTPGTCGTCGHHKGRKTFHETCPRLGELLFKGGTKSAKVLMEETAGGHPCLFWIPKGADRFGPCPEKNSMGTCMHGASSCPHNTAEARAAVGCTYPIQPPHFAGDMPIMPKKKPKRKTLIHILIEPTEGELLESGRKYRINCDGPLCGMGGSQATKIRAVYSILQTLNGWTNDRSKFKLPITEMDVTLEDKTGDFSRDDFFEKYGGLKEAPDWDIPSIASCQHRGCTSFDHESFLCITTGQNVEEMTYCPAAYKDGPKKKPARKSKKTKKEETHAED